MNTHSCTHNARTTPHTSQGDENDGEEDDEDESVAKEDDDEEDDEDVIEDDDEDEADLIDDDDDDDDKHENRHLVALEAAHLRARSQPRGGSFKGKSGGAAQKQPKPMGRGSDPSHQPKSRPQYVRFFSFTV